MWTERRSKGPQDSLIPYSLPYSLLSLGGAMASLMAVEVHLTYPKLKIALVTIGIANSVLTQY